MNKKNNPEFLLRITLTLFALVMMIFVLDSCANKEKKPKILYYANPMDPSAHSDKPMKDPMGMDYIPVYEDQLKNNENDKNKIQGYTEINIPYEKQQLIGVKYGTVEKKEMTQIIRAVGKVSHDTELYNTIQEYYNALSYYYKLKNSENPDSAASAKILLDSTILKLKILGFNDNEISKLSQGNSYARSLLLTEGSGKAWIEASVFESDIIYVKK